MKPEDKARVRIDAMLDACGWAVQSYSDVDFTAGRGVALTEAPMKVGTADYLLLVDRKPVGIIEAKKEGERLSGVAEQSTSYGRNLPDLFQVEGALPFYYESTGTETWFRDERDPDARSREVFAFHRPETLAEWLTESDTLRDRLRHLPLLATSGMRDCQIEAITNLERSFAGDKPRALIQMATGAGKTFMACAAIYRLIKYGKARRILFLVDRSNLGRQATTEFQQYVTPDTGRKFTELYNIQHLTSNTLDPVSKVTICTIQRLYSMLRGEELAEDVEELSGFELASADNRTKDVEYNPAIPIETYDFIITDECHRSIYGLWRQVLEYFDAYLIGLTATPSKQTIGFFNQNLVMEYNHERAVADGVNVGYDVYRIRTQVTEAGGKVEKGFFVDKRSKETRAVRWERLDEDLSYTNTDLDRSVVVPSQIRTVLEAFKDALFTDLFPGRTLVPKTLIFAKDDSHAEDIVRICREVFGKGNDFCKKITYKSYDAESKRYEKSEKLIQEFRTSPQMRIAVTVDMIATGTDVKPLECLLFMRDVRSRGYFEQMKGRAVRVLSPTDLQSVSGADAHAKDHFVVVDAVGVCESDKSDSRPLERKRNVAFKDLLLGVTLGKRDEDTLTSLAGRLARLDRDLDQSQRKQVQEVSEGITLSQLSANLLRAIDPDVVEAASRRFYSEYSEHAPRSSVHDDPNEVEAVAGYFDPLEPVEFYRINLPHLRQEGVMYFVTFRLADSMPAEKLREWLKDRGAWLKLNPPPHTQEQEQQYRRRFTARIEHWLDQGSGSCVLAMPECRTIVENALRHFDGDRYILGEYVVAPNHVHVIVSPRDGWELSDILHSWKSFTSHEILNVDAAARRLLGVEAAARRLLEKRTNPRGGASTGAHVWQKESYDHMVRGPGALVKIEEYIRSHNQKQRRDAAATLIADACSPFDKPLVRDTLIRLKQLNEQTIDNVTSDTIVAHGFDAAAKEKAESTVRTFREYIEEHKAEIEALQILYSRPFRMRLTEEALKDLEAKLKPQFGVDPIGNVWTACERTADRSSAVPALSATGTIPARSKKKRRDGASTVHRFTDLVSLVRFALKQEPVLEPFEAHVNRRFDAWLEEKKSAGALFSMDELGWLEKMRDYIIASGSVDRDHLEADNVLGPIYGVFGERLWGLMDEMNLVLAA